ncbi:hypothetical protein M409DRAFT_35387 [Zasmidium cellare ATCC 36951]|uniref:Uncharacterized protein n=1 Tax=Zasmidium cellare ATCC 36951 TaxID=1080233 RepID=A0A6A6D0R7_ZASCE|nr:uncharacterized protein M409DRAFT_35387 [Zasmidium cellare ATCC 36951]KAF2172613.1 hypothetical protein M409DRAFT_35387 [Zasmidium cellare ATCC 36951]
MDFTDTKTEATTVLLFGPQTLSFQEKWFQQLRSAINNEKENQWMRQVVSELPQYLETLGHSIPSTASHSSAALARSISEWLDSDASQPTIEKLPNAILTPLVILSHLDQYSQFVESTATENKPSQNPWNVESRSLKVLGFCTGFLSALAVACAKSKADFQTYGATAVRLGALIGAVVDAADIASIDSASFSTAWNSVEQEEEFKAVIEHDSDAYTSVYYDETRATVTTSAVKSASLRQQLKQKGLVASEIGLRGRYHWQGHRQNLENLVKFTEERPELQLPEAKSLLVPLSSTTDGEPITEGRLHHIALRDILVEPCQWYSTFNNVVGDGLDDEGLSYVIFGEEKCIPPTILRRINEPVIFMADQKDAKSKLAALNSRAESDYGDDIAVVGMSCKVAGADDVDELWDLMCKGESQHTEVPESRFTFDTQWREKDPNRKWFGNFLRDHDSFDHKFFKKSPREVSSQDPQQRLFLQSAYQAVEQSGYFNQPNPDKRVGVFVGLTIDTACSASAVAIHQACRAILSGECTSSLAGGVTIMTSPLWFQNLAGATFLSPTGACKPFDAKADGYCRGEAIASVFLKKMSQAVADGDTIIGRVRSTAVYQNDNCTPIFVPNAPSLSTLFEDVVEKARLRREDISLVEAHGTGTPVGDPAEYESIRRVLGGRSRRTSPLHLGSVKGLIGHTESASGVMALIKVLLALYHGYVPPQASFQTLSSGVKATPDDMIEINKQLVPWKPAYRAALINNYGASGSNASMVISQAYATRKVTPPVISAGEAFWIPGTDERSLREYCIRLRALISKQKASSEVEVSVANIAYSLARQSNRTLPLGLIFQCASVQELENKLTGFVDGKISGAITTRPQPRPVILCFGGQISQSIGLDKMVYDRYGLLRSYLDRCDSILVSLGFESIYPTIFEKMPITDVVKLQTTLFAFQYSCAKSWIDSGVEVSSVVGHSFGELTAMCVAGVLSLKDTIRLIGARAQLVKDSWGPDSGAMIAVEAELSEVHELLRKFPETGSSERVPSIACYNGPRSFTLAGSTAAIKAVEAAARSMPGIRSKVLSVANAYHSTLVEPLEEQLAKLAKGMLFTKAQLHWERATEEPTDTKLTPSFFASHMRQPVYANHAFQRLNQKFPSAIWLEAGSNSTITNMASRALGPPKTSHFQPANMCGSAGLQSMLDMFTNLWKEGLLVHHWNHHASQARLYDVVLLPAYQFEKSKHWLELKKPQPVVEAAPEPVKEEPLPAGLFTFVGYQDEARSHARFRVNTMIKKYEELVSGHVVAGTAPILPATVQIDIVIEALLSLRPDFEASKLQPEIHNVSNQIPVCVNPSRSVWVDLRCTDSHKWDWEMNSNGPDGSQKLLHVKGQVLLRSAEDPKLSAEFARYERMINHKRCHDLLHHEDPDDIIQGRNMYKTFGEIVNYSTPYHGLQKLVGKDGESAGRVVKKRSTDSWLDAHLSDCFSQVGGFWVNCMTDRKPTDMYIAAGFESWVRAPQVQRVTSEEDDAADDNPISWDVMAIHQKESSKQYTTDIFIYDSETGVLREVILGVNYSRIPKSTMTKSLLRLTVNNPSSKDTAAPSKAAQYSSAAAAPVAAQPEPAVEPKVVEKAPASKEGGSRSLSSVIETLGELTGLETDGIKPSTMLADIGIDSLMGMEMSHELEESLKCTLDMDQLADATTIQDVVNVVAAALGEDAIDGNESTDDSTSEEGDATGLQTPEPSPGTPDTNLSDDEAEELKPDSTAHLQVPETAVLEAFGESKLLTDKFIEDFKCSGYLDNINPKQTQLCIALIVEAFEELGCPIKSAKSGDVLERILYAPQHGRLVQYLYEVLETDGRLINTDGDVITRTAVSVPFKSSKEIVDSLVAAYTDHNFANRLTYYCGGYLVDVLKGKADGVKVIFGSEEGRNLVAGLYGESLLNKLFYTQMKDIVRRLFSRLPSGGSAPFKILEMGAGTGGTTQYLVPLLAELTAEFNVPVEYTFTDLSPSFVAAARKKYKSYPFMKFFAHDIEKPPSDASLVGSQHLVVASNAVHATHSLPVSLKNIHKFLRPDGFVMMLEMTSQVRWVDMIFGLLEGWWLFDDGRPHALSHQSNWEKELHAAGYGHVDYTDGHHPENTIQRIIIAKASGSQHDRLPVPVKAEVIQQLDDTSARESAVDGYAKKYTSDFVRRSANSPSKSDASSVVLVTGATGSVGSHLVAHLAALPNISKVICLNRPSRSLGPDARQQQALKDRGIDISERDLAKCIALASDTSKPRLGLAEDQYTELTKTVTHVVHNAWPMSGNRPIQRFEQQFQTMRNLIDLCNEASSNLSRVISFQFISSIAVVGHHTFLTGKPNVPEEKVKIGSVLPNGYGDAKWACERMLDDTLGKHPSYFRTMSVRLGQVAGSSKTGYWNSQEHLSFLVKSSQTLRCLPDFKDGLSWTPVDMVAGTLSDLLLQTSTQPYPIYHIDNPVRQSWSSMIRVWASALNIPLTNVIPFEEWVARVRHFPGSVEKDNPAFKLVDFLDGNFLRMSCGGLLLDTDKSRKHSPTLAGVGPVADEVAISYIDYWKRSGFLPQ